MPVTVRKISPSTFEVSVEGKIATAHSVTAPPEYVAKLTGGAASAAVLVEKSFEFLLEREPNTSILRRFELPVIQRYFPEYEAAMKVHFGV